MNKFTTAITTTSVVIILIGMWFTFDLMFGRMQRNAEDMLEMTQDMVEITKEMEADAFQILIETDHIHGDILEFNMKLDKLEGLVSSIEEEENEEDGIKAKQSGLRM